VKELTTTVNDYISRDFAKVGLTHEDGKIELGCDPERRLILVDVLGTLDECRFTYEGLPVSKEIARIWYRGTQWFKDTEEAKKRDRNFWKDICRSKPEPLPPQLMKLISQIYCACTNEVTGREWFPGTPPLKETLEEIKSFLKQA
ncbi:MAG: phosphoribosylaminoimidazolesuccinocarboxamide synthase, partial [Actinomycetota bacterium]